MDFFSVSSDLLLLSNGRCILGDFVPLRVLYTFSSDPKALSLHTVTALAIACICLCASQQRLFIVIALIQFS